MKVDQIIKSLDVGGSERQVIGLSSQLRDMGVDCRLIVLRGGSLCDSARRQGLSVVEFGASNGAYPRTSRDWALNAKDAVEIARLWHNSPPDAVQAWLAHSQIVGLPLARIFGIRRRVMMIRSMQNSVNFGPLTRRAFALAARSSTAITANSRAALWDPEWPLHGVPTPRFLVPNGVELPNRQASPEKQPVQAVVVGNFYPLKGHLPLLEALHRVDIPIRVKLVGEGPLDRRIRMRISDLGLRDRVQIVTDCHNPTELLLDSQFLISNSSTEGMPNAILEAMAAGLPALALDIPGARELIDHNEDGFLIPPRDNRGLAEAISWIASNPSWRWQAGLRARKKAENFTWQRMAEETIKVLST